MKKRNKIPRRMDPITRFLRQRQISPFFLFAFLFILNIAIDIVLAIYYGAWYPKGGIRGLSNDYAGWMIDFVMQPAIIAYFYWIQYAGQEITDSLQREGIIQKDESTENVIKKYNSKLYSPYARYLSLIFVVLTAFWILLLFSDAISPTDSIGWNSFHTNILIVRLLVTMIVAYALVMFIYGLFIMLFMLRELLEPQKVRVKPLHHDNAGGLGAIGIFSSNLGYIIGIIGLTLAIVNIQDPPQLNELNNIYISMLSFILIYLILAPVVFFTPLLSAHKVMVAFRDRLISEVSDEFNVTYKYLRSIRSNNSDQLKPIFQRIDLLKEERILINNFPTWPVSTRNLRKYFGLVITPIAPIGISLVVDLITNILQR